MHTVNQIVNIVTHVTSKPRSRVSLLARRLTDGGVLPKSSGRHIKLVDRSAAVALLFTAARADRVEDAVSTSQAFAVLPYRGDSVGLVRAEMKSGGPPTVIEPKAQLGLPLAEHLVALLAPDAKDRCTLGLAKDASGRPSAIVKTHLQDGVSTSMQFFRDDTADSWSRETFTLSADAFDALRELLAREGGVSFTGAATGDNEGNAK